jgi:hypothetical protein
MINVMAKMWTVKVHNLHMAQIFQGNGRRVFLLRIRDTMCWQSIGGCFTSWKGTFNNTKWSL